jgi:hypothetical protein
MSLTTASLVGSGHLDKAAIFGAAGDSVWAQTPGYKVRGLTTSPVGSTRDLLYMGMSDAISFSVRGRH